MAKVESFTSAKITELIAASADCKVGPVVPTPLTGKGVLWVDTSAPGYVTLSIVIGD